MADRKTAFSVWSAMREMDKEQRRRRAINHFINTSFVSFPAQVTAAAVAHVSILHDLMGSFTTCDSLETKAVFVQSLTSQSRLISPQDYFTRIPYCKTPPL